MLVKRILVALAIAASSFTELASAQTCSNPRVRKEWRNMSVLERASYIIALQCMHLKPGVMKNYANNYGAKTRYEDFVAIHKHQTPLVHWVGHFLAWHRLFIWNFETALREECGYIGAQPYWDFRLDAGSANMTATSPVFDQVLGFGTNGRYDPDAPLPPGAPNLGAGGCIYNGPFAWWRINVSQDLNNPNAANPPGCIRRNINQSLTQMWFSPGKEEELIDVDNFVDLDNNISGTAPAPAGLGLHLGGHATVGGSNSIPATANVDPTFWLLHTNLDRVWNRWQLLDEDHVWQTGGPLNPRVYQVYFGPFIPGNVTLNTQVHLQELASPVKVGQLHDTEGLGQDVPGVSGAKGILCYKYV